MTSLRLLAVLNVPSSTPPRAKRLAPRPDGLLTHFASSRGEKCRLDTHPLGAQQPGARHQRFQVRPVVVAELDQRQPHVAALEPG